MTTGEKILHGGGYLIEDATAGTVFTPEDFSDEQLQLADTTDQFLREKVLPHVEKLENHDFDLMVKLLRQFGELGLLMIDAPEEYGGLDLPKTTSMLAAEKASIYGGFSVAYTAHSGIGTLPLVYYGTKEQKERYLGKIITGEWMAAYCLTEPDSGSDALGAKATATLTPDGKHYLLNGTKQFITNGSFADLYTVFAKIDRQHFTAFLVERTFEGVKPGPQEKKLGIRGSSTTSLILEDAKVPVENVLGEIGKGHKIAFNVLNVGRLKLGACVTGAGKFAFAEGVRYANLRKQFGVTIGTFGAIREKIADTAAALFASEALVYRVAGMIDDRLAAVPKGIPDYYDAYQQGIEDYSIECAVAKVFCSDVLALVVDEVVQIFGGYGYTQEYPAERFYRDERINRIFEGTNEINRMLIPGTLLRRAMKGEIPLQEEVMKAVGRLSAAAGEAPSGPFGAEKALLRNLKDAFLVLAGAAVQRFGGKVKDEQETLIALADVAIGVFAIESAVLRAGEDRRLRERLPRGARRGGRQGVRVPGGRGGDQRGAARGVLRRRGEHAADAPLRDPAGDPVRRLRPPRREAEARRRRPRIGALPALRRSAPATEGASPGGRGRIKRTVRRTALSSGHPCATGGSWARGFREECPRRRSSLELSGVGDEEARRRAVAPAAVVASVRAGRRRGERRPDGFRPPEDAHPQRCRHPQETLLQGVRRLALHGAEGDDPRAAPRRPRREAHPDELRVQEGGEGEDRRGVRRGSCEQLPHRRWSAEAKAFLSWFTADFVAGDTVDISLSPDGTVSASHNGKALGTLRDPASPRPCC